MSTKRISQLPQNAKPGDIIKVDRAGNGFDRGDVLIVLDPNENLVQDVSSSKGTFLSTEWYTYLENAKISSNKEAVTILWEYFGVNPEEFLIYRSQEPIKHWDLPEVFQRVPGSERIFLDETIDEGETFHYAVGTENDDSIIFQKGISLSSMIENDITFGEPYNNSGAKVFVYLNENFELSDEFEHKNGFIQPSVTSEFDFGFGRLVSIVGLQLDYTQYKDMPEIGSMLGGVDPDDIDVLWQSNMIAIMEYDNPVDSSFINIEIGSGRFELVPPMQIDVMMEVISPDSLDPTKTYASYVLGGEMNFIINREIIELDSNNSVSVKLEQISILDQPTTGTITGIAGDTGAFGEPMYGVGTIQNSYPLGTIESQDSLIFPQTVMWGPDITGETTTGQIIACYELGTPLQQYYTKYFEHLVDKYGEVPEVLTYLENFEVKLTINAKSYSLKLSNPTALEETLWFQEIDPSDIGTILPESGPVTINVEILGADFS